MSGGHWNYRRHMVQEHLDEVAMDGTVMKRFPKLAGVFSELSSVLYDAIRELDYDLSGDSRIDEDREWERSALKALQDALSADPSVGHGIPLWYAFSAENGTQGPYATQVEAWKSLEEPGIGERKMGKGGSKHRHGSYVWPELKSEQEK